MNLVLGVVLDILVPFVAGLCTLAAIFYIVRAFQDRTKSTRAAYGVGRQEARQSMQVDLVYGVGALLLGLVLVGVYSLTLQGVAVEPSVTVTSDLLQTVLPASPIVTIAPATATNTAVPIPTVLLPASPTTAVIPPTATQLSLPTETPTTAPATAIVQSGVGVYLRSLPSTTGEQLEWLLDGTVVALLAGQETADGFTWQQVRVSSGQEGWVVLDYLVLNQ